VVVNFCNPSSAGSIGKRIVVQGGYGKNARPYLKNNQSKEGLKW
jgi:hypothetical protein